MPELHDHILSDRCYAVRLMLALLGVAYTKRTVGYDVTRAPRSPEVVALNPAGDIPVLVDGEVVLSEPSSILTYLCAHYDPAAKWRARDTEVRRWLAFAGGPLSAMSEARAVLLFGAKGDRATLLTASRAALRQVEDHLGAQTLAGAAFLAGHEASLADVAVFPAVALSHDCGIGHEDYPAINLWQRRIRRLDGFISMPGIPDYF